MKLSFSLPSNCSSKSKNPSSRVTSRFDDINEDQSNESPMREYLTEFDPSQTLSSDKKITIPPVENEDRARKKLTSLESHDLEASDPDNVVGEVAGVTVASFAAALLRGYGWDEGRGIGKNAKEDVKVKQFEKRAWRQGLGFSDHE